MPEKTLLIRGARVVDPLSELDGERNVLVEGRKISAVLEPGAPGPAGATEIDASGQVLLPGPLDLHSHLREPGFEYKETIATGTRAAVRGGFTAVCCMPNTEPVNDEPAITRYILKKAAADGACPVYPFGAVTKGQQGASLAEMAALVEAGCVAFSDDGRPVMDALIMRRALEYSRIFGVPIVSHAEDGRLSAGGVMNEGLTATRLGLPGIPNAAEDVMIARDIALAELTGGRLHVAHVSTRGGVRLVRDARQRGLAVTAETCPHYFTISEEAVAGYNTAAKVNPPLRTREDKEAIIEGIQDGTLGMIATDHAPHHREEKAMGFDDAPPGISGFETALALSCRLVRTGLIDWTRLAMLLAVEPARLLGLPPRTVAPGAEAHLVLLDPEHEWEVRPDEFLSLGKNTPFEGLRLKGRVTRTLVGGEVTECL